MFYRHTCRTRRWAENSLPLITVTLLFCCLSTTLVRAQTINPRDPTAAQRARINAETDRRNRDRDLMHIRDGRAPEDNPRLRAARQAQMLTQIRKDYVQLQELDNQIRAALSAQTLNYKLVAEKSGDLNKCASRLKESLALPRLDENEKQQKKQPAIGEIVNLKAALLALDRRITSFVTSPFFKNLGTVDAETATNTSNDLRHIIELSNGIKKAAERMHKTSAANH